MNCRDPVFWDSVCFIQMSSLKLISTSPQTRLQYGTWLHKACCWLLVNSAQSTVTDHFTCLIVDIPLQQRNRIRQVTTRFCQHCQPAHKHFTQEDILLYYSSVDTGESTAKYWPHNQEKALNVKFIYKSFTPVINFYTVQFCRFIIPICPVLRDDVVFNANRVLVQ